MALTEYERARAARIASNQAKMASLGIAEAAQQLQQTAKAAQAPKPKPTPRKRKLYEIEVEVRRSGRLQGEKPEYNEENLFARELGIDRLDLIAAPRRRRVGVNPSQLASIRERRIKEADGEDAEVPRGPFDSGLGVRIQGGRVYDSKYGVTCHWCRQKTLEEHVSCSHPDCGGGKRLPVSFCKLCLKNRHGEDILQAEASGKWVCPRCRGSCGDGCKLCCNCGPCRKAAGLAPTHQIINQARTAGFDNVHDYLVHQQTGESAEEIAARKRAAAWGAWLDVPFDPVAAAAAAAAGLDAEEQAAAEPVAVAAAVQLDAAAAEAPAVPECAGAALLLYRALRWHLLAASFCAAVKALAPLSQRRSAKPAATATARSRQHAAPSDAAKAKAAATPMSTAAAAAPRRSGRGQAAPTEQQQQQSAKRATKVTAYFQVASAAKKKVTDAADAAAVAAAGPKAAVKAGVVGGPAPRASTRLGMRARK